MYNVTMTGLLICRLTRAHAESARAGVRDATRPPVLLHPFLSPTTYMVLGNVQVLV